MQTTSNESTYRRRRRILYLSLASSAKALLVRCKELCGGFCLCTSVFVPKIKVESKLGRHWTAKRPRWHSQNIGLASWNRAERGTKTRSGQEQGHQRAFQPKLYATNADSCPVASVRRKWINRIHHFIWLSKTTAMLLTKSGTRRHRLEKLKLEIFCQRWLKKQIPNKVRG